MCDPSEEQISTWLYRYILDNKIQYHKTIIDIGANNGIEYSNSSMFIRELGWKGVLVEPQPDLIENLEYRFKGCHVIILNKAISNISGYGFINTASTDKDNNTGCSLSNRGGNQRWYIQIITFQELMKFIPYKNIDILSIDSEGYDCNIIDSMLRTDIRPRFIITETWKDWMEDWKQELLLIGRYEFIMKKGSNKIYEYTPYRSLSRDSLKDWLENKYL